MLLEPAGNFDVVYLAEPEFRVTVAKTVVPFKNSTLPVGVPHDDETLAVKLTGLPDTEGLRDESSVVVVVFFNPTPFTGTICGPAPQLRAIAADLAPTTVGVNVTVIVQCSPGAMLSPSHVPLGVKSPAPVSATALPFPTVTAKEIVWAREFVTVTV